MSTSITFGLRSRAAHVAVAAAIAIVTITASSTNHAARRETATYWDTYGVPHIFASDTRRLFREFGYAQTRSHGNLLLRFYALARGRGAEYFGQSAVDSDIWVRTNGIPGRAAEWYEEQTPEFRRYLDAFAEGINAYGREHAADLSEEARRVLPVSGVDVIAHTHRVIHFSFMTSPRVVQALVAAAPAAAVAASNAWALAGSRTRSGKPNQLANPHLPWSEEFTFYEAQLQSPDIDAYGTTLVGFPVPGIAFNRDLAWTHTVSSIDGVDLYRLTPSGDGYLYDGAVTPFEKTEEQYLVRAADGTMETRTLTIRRSVHGPVVAEKSGSPIAMRVAGLDRPGLCQQWWDMARARNLQQFEAATRRLQLPIFNIVYADRRGHILYLFNGLVPKRESGDWRLWNGVVPGDRSASLWTAVHDYEDLPRVLDPATGWVQNTNDPPWSATLPFPLDPAAFPRYLAPDPSMSFRTQRSIRSVMSMPKMSFDDVVRLKHLTRLETADRLVDAIVKAAQASGRASAQRAADVLAAWDRNTDAGSRGAVLFAQFAQDWQRSGGNFAKPWSRAMPLDTPAGLADPNVAVTALERAAETVERAYGAIDVAWGDVNRFRRDAVDLPGNGASATLGAFRVIGYGVRQNDRLVADSGDSFVMVVDFGAKPLKAAVLLGYGNASQPGSPHRTDQYPLMAGKQLRPVWLTREDVLAHPEAPSETR